MFSCMFSLRGRIVAARDIEKGCLMTPVANPGCSLTLIEGLVAGPPQTRDLSGVSTVELDVRSRTVSGVAVAVSVVFAGDVPVVQEGDHVLAVGATRRRFFRSSGATVSRTEVEASKLLINPTRRQRRKVLDDVVAVVREVSGTGSGES
jgi:hypothetical protein